MEEEPTCLSVCLSPLTLYSPCPVFTLKRWAKLDFCSNWKFAVGCKQRVKSAVWGGPWNQCETTHCGKLGGMTSVFSGIIWLQWFPNHLRQQSWRRHEVSGRSHNMTTTIVPVWMISKVSFLLRQHRALIFKEAKDCEDVDTPDDAVVVACLLTGGSSQGQ